MKILKIKHLLCIALLTGFFTACEQSSYIDEVEKNKEVQNKCIFSSAANQDKEVFFPSTSIKSTNLDAGVYYENIAYKKEVFVSSSQSDFPKHQITNGDDDAWKPSIEDNFIWFYVDLGKIENIEGIRLLSGDDNDNGIVKDYDIYITNNLPNWTKVAEIKNNFEKKDQLLGEAAIQYIAIQIKRGTPTANNIYVREFEVLQSRNIAGEDVKTCGETVQMNATLPNGCTKGMWTVVEGFARFSDPFSPTTNTLFISSGNNKLKWEVFKNGQSQGYDFVTISNKEVKAFVENDKIFVSDNTTVLYGFPIENCEECEYKWTQVSGEKVTILYANTNKAKVEGLNPLAGGYIFKYSITNGFCSDEKTVSVIVW